MVNADWLFCLLSNFMANDSPDSFSVVTLLKLILDFLKTDFFNLLEKKS